MARRKPKTEAGKNLIAAINAGEVDVDLRVIRNAANERLRNVLTSVAAPYHDWKEGDYATLVPKDHPLMANAWMPKYMAGALVKVVEVLPVTYNNATHVRVEVIKLEYKPRGFAGEEPRYQVGSHIGSTTRMLIPYSEEDLEVEYGKAKQELLDRLR